MPSHAPIDGIASDPPEAQALSALQAWANELDFRVDEMLCMVRIQELFDMIADIPDSFPAVTELRQALDRTQQYGRLAEALRQTLTRRILPPGATTTQILEIYISTIKVLRLLDPSDVVLEAVTGPVRQYLQNRR